MKGLALGLPPKLLALHSDGNIFLLLAGWEERVADCPLPWWKDSVTPGGITGVLSLEGGLLVLKTSPHFFFHGWARGIYISKHL